MNTIQISQAHLDIQLARLEACVAGMHSWKSRLVAQTSATLSEECCTEEMNAYDAALQVEQNAENAVSAAQAVLQIATDLRNAAWDVLQNCLAECEHS